MIFISCRLIFIIFQELSSDLSSVFSSKCLKVLLALLEPPDEFLAKELDRALNRLGSDSEVVSEVKPNGESGESSQGTHDNFYINF